MGLPWGIIHVYTHYIQRSSLKPIGQSKSNFIGKHLYEGGTNYVIINKPGHMTKMAAITIHGENTSNIFFAGTAEPIATKIDIK